MWSGSCPAPTPTISSSAFSAPRAPVQQRRRVSGAASGGLRNAAIRSGAPEPGEQHAGARPAGRVAGAQRAGRVRDRSAPRSSSAAPMGRRCFYAARDRPVRGKAEGKILHGRGGRVRQAPATILQAGRRRAAGIPPAGGALPGGDTEGSPDRGRSHPGAPAQRAARWSRCASRASPAPARS